MNEREEMKRKLSKAKSLYALRKNASQKTTPGIVVEKPPEKINPFENTQNEKNILYRSLYSFP